jgi:hypothetical protein
MSRENREVSPLTTMIRDEYKAMAGTVKLAVRNVKKIGPVRLLSSVDHLLNAVIQLWPATP